MFFHNGNIPRVDSKAYFALFCFILTVGVIRIAKVPAQEENLSVLDGWMEYTDRSNALYHHLSAQVYKQIAQREKQIDLIDSASRWRQRQKEIEEIFEKITGPFPARTPLNSRVVGRVDKEGYHFEKIIYESQPGFFVTGCLFLPDDIEGKTPAVIYCSGHSELAHKSPVYQHVILNLVTKGFIVFAFDPVGQGERMEYYNAQTGESLIGGPTKEHSYPGAQCFLIGRSLARHMIWDGIRAVDFLLTRKEVDERRIGITGRSGGGTQSSYIAAFDGRITAAAPECYITGFRRLLESIGPQDAEQNFYHSLAEGIDHADLLTVRAPRPALMITTSRDFFSIQGARETAEEVKRAYAAFGHVDRFSMVEDDAGHESTRKNREAMYAFFQNFLTLPGDPTDREVDLIPSDELRVTETGQISTSLKSETIFSLNKKEAERAIENLNESRKNLSQHLETVVKTAEGISGFVYPAAQSDAVFTGRYHRPGYVVEKHFLQGEGNYVIPFLLMRPDSVEFDRMVLYLHPDGKERHAASNGEMEWLVKNGCAVLAPDLMGIGEMGPGIFTGDAYDFRVGRASYNIWFLGIQTARSITGILAGDVVRLVHFIRKTYGDSIRIHAIAHAQLCTVLQHAAVFEKSFSGILLLAPLISNRALVINRYYKPLFIPYTVAGSMPAYDLPDLCAALTPIRQWVVNPTDQNGKPATQQQIEAEYDIVKKAYSSRSADSQLRIVLTDPQQKPDEIFSAWLR